MKEKEKEEKMIDKINPIELEEINKPGFKNVIIKCNKEFLSFEKKNYNPILEDYIPKWEWDIIIEEANCIIGNAFHLRKQEEKVEIPRYMNLIFWIIFYFSLIDFIFLIIYTSDENFSEIVLFIALILIIISCGIIIVLMIYNYIRKLKEERTIDEFIIDGMKQYIDVLNEIYAHIASFKNDHNFLQIECILLNKSH